ncbi:hypothetical protein ACFPRL_15550 [Pseudoclavibacter helvolus]
MISFSEQHIASCCVISTITSGCIRCRVADGASFVTNPTRGCTTGPK